MAVRIWFLTAPALAVLVAAGAATVLRAPDSRQADGRIGSKRLAEMEAELGVHLYAPTWLPRGGRPGPLGIKQGSYRILSDFSDDDRSYLCILAQEPRSPERDRYLHNRLIRHADATVEIPRPSAAAAPVAGATHRKGYLMTGRHGERRLIWFEHDAALILSSPVLADTELVRVAASVR